MSKDPWFEAFCSRDANEIFHSVTHRQEIWKDDPFDVEEIHGEARATFEALVERATNDPSPQSGRIYLVKGESGAGKTHLMRAFRNYVHGAQLGNLAYMQMTSTVTDYSRYVLSNTIDSLDQPYNELLSDESGLVRLSNALVEDPGVISAEDLEILRTTDSQPERNRLVNRITNKLYERRRELDGIDSEVIPALVYLQNQTPRLRTLVLRFLRCEDFSRFDREILGDLVPMTGESDPQRVLEHLARVSALATRGAFVICLDQLEDIFEKTEESEERFRRAIRCVTEVVDRVPTAICVVSCLADFHSLVRNTLTRSMIDRLEKDPSPCLLKAQRTPDEAEKLVSVRLGSLYEAVGLRPPEECCYPFQRDDVRALTQRTRDILVTCQEAQQLSRQTGHLPKIDGGILGGAVREAPVLREKPVAHSQTVEQEWNDYRASVDSRVPDTEEEAARDLAWALEATSEEMADSAFKVEARPDENAIRVLVPSGETFTVGICDASTRGGALGKQVAELEKTTGGDKAVVVRRTGFKYGPNTKIAKLIGSKIREGWRKATVEDAAWRTISCLRAFKNQRGDDPSWTAWVQEEKPLTQIHAIRVILDWDHLEKSLKTTPVKEVKPSPPPVVLSPAEEPKPFVSSSAEGLTGDLQLGLTQGFQREDVALSPPALCRHAAFVGGTGSGKTTLALNIIEQLLEREIPVILIDRKGDLVSYASENAWRTAEDEAQRDRQQRLRESLDVSIYTPGEPIGHDLSLRVIPKIIDTMPDRDIQAACQQAADALADMLGYKRQGSSAVNRAILIVAIRYLVSIMKGKENVGIGDLVRLVGDCDDGLVERLPHFDPKRCARLAEGLDTLRIQNENLFSLGEEILDIERLLKRSKGRGKLSVISTKFLGDDERILFWVSRFMSELNQYVGAHPSDSLQAIVMFDEADLYLPASSKPVTKDQMEDALKRFRSGGVGLFLATQSPGDLDYKSRDNIQTWFVGRVKEANALKKLQPMFAGQSTDLAAKIPAQQTGEFAMLSSGKAKRFKSHRSLVDAEQLSDQQILDLARLSRSLG